MSDTFLGICVGTSHGDRTCQVFVTGAGLEARSGDEKLGSMTWSFMEVSVVGVNDRYLKFESKGTSSPVALLVSDRGIVEAIERSGAPGALLGKLRDAAARRGRRRLAHGGLWFGVSAAAAVLLLSGWALFSWAFDKAVELVPVEWEVELGKAAAASVLEEHRVCTDPQVERAMQVLGTRLMAGVGASPYRFRVRVLDDEEVNAFALPGGYIFVNRGLIEESDGPGEVAGVLAHEIQHVLSRHGIENIVNRAGLMVAASVLVGDMGGIQEVLLYNAAALASMSYNREQEREADAGGLEIMYRAGLDVEGLPRFLEKLSEEKGALDDALSILSTHPASSQRVERLRELIAARGAPSAKPLSIDWDGLRGRCSPTLITDPED